MLYACVGLSCPKPCHVWRPSRAWSCLVTPDAHKALFEGSSFGMHCHDASCFVHTYPLFCSVRRFLTTLVCATHWLYMHLYMLCYMSIHESCLLVCCPCFKTMKLWTSDPNLHLSLADTTFCFLSCFVVHFLACLPFRLSACHLVCLLSLLLICLHSCYTCHIYLACSLCVILLLSTHFYSIACLLVSCLFLCMYAHGARTHGARAWSSKCKQKGAIRSMGQMATVNRFSV